MITTRSDHIRVPTLALALALAVALLMLISTAKPGEAAFPGQNGKIAFTAGSIGDRSDIYTVNPDGTGVTNITNTPRTDQAFSVPRAPAFSADGSKIAFAASPPQNPTDIYTMNPNGTGLTRITNTPEEGEGDPAFSPDGSKIVFSATRARAIYMVNANGSNRTLLTADANNVPVSPVFSPDGTKIAFVSGRAGGGTTDIFVMDAAPESPTNQPQHLTTNSVNEVGPDWGVLDNTPPDTTPPTINVPANITVDATSPDGARVAYTVTATDDGDPNPAVSCDPASGSTFPIGTTTVKCTATDSSGNSANASFNVVVKGAAEQISTLKETVANLGLESGLNRSLQAKLNDTLAHLKAGRTTLACNKLDEFISEVSAQSGNKIETRDAQRLTTDANRIKAVLACK
jgi:dipeptidyl aminopeptidase/acylaminoacyl peptidase